MVHHFRSNLLSWLSVFWSQPYFAWHSLIREQERPCAQGTPREGSPGLPSLHQGLACVSACDAPGLLLSPPLSLTHNPKVLNPFLSWKIAAMELLSHGISLVFSGKLEHQQRQGGSSAVGCALKELRVSLLNSMWEHLFCAMGPHEGSEAAQRQRDEVCSQPPQCLPCRVSRLPPP